MNRLLLLMLILCVGSASALAQETRLRAEKTPTSVKIFHGTQLVTEYVYSGEVRQEKTSATKPLAKPYFFPLNAPNGVGVTRPWPMVRGTPGETTDHFHQKSMWFCHGDVIPEGLNLKVRSADKRVEGVDFWSEAPGHGWIVCKAVGEPKLHAADQLSLETQNEWQTADHVGILNETRLIHVRQFPQGTLIQLDVTLTADRYPITFGDTKEGAMGLRVHDALRAQKGSTGTLVNDAGKKTEKDIWGYDADWCDYFGTLDNKTVGVALFDHPKNQHRAAWHARGYGLLAANPFGRKASGFPSRKDQTELVKLPRGESLKLTYGVYVHSGDTAAGQVAEVYKSFRQ